MQFSTNDFLLEIHWFLENTSESNAFDCNHWHNLWSFSSYWETYPVSEAVMAALEAGLLPRAEDPVEAGDGPGQPRQQVEDHQGPAHRPHPWHHNMRSQSAVLYCNVSSPLLTASSFLQNTSYSEYTAGASTTRHPETTSHTGIRGGQASAGVW